VNPNAETQQSVDTLPVFQPPATLGQVWGANFSAAGLNTPIGVQQPRNQAFGDLFDAYSRATGRNVFDDAAAAGHSLAMPAFTNGQLTGALSSDEQHEVTGVIGDLASRLPDAQRQQVAPFLDVDGRAATIAQEAEQRAANVNARAYGLTDVGASYVAGLARSLADPTTIPMALVGGPESSGVATMLAREFAVNAGFGAFTHVATAPERERLGLDNASLLGDAASAGVFGAGLGLVMRGAGWTLRRAMGRDAGGEAAPVGYKPTTTPPPDLHAELSQFEPADFDAAARFQDRETAMNALAPVQTMPGWMEARAATDAAAAKIEQGNADAPLTAAPVGMREAGVAPLVDAQEGEAAARGAASPDLQAADAKANAEAAALAALPAVEPGSVRFFHGGDNPTSGGGRWVTTDPAYAASFRGDKQLHYVDLPKDAPEVVAAQNWETGQEGAYGPNQVGTYNQFETSAEQAQGFKPVLPDQGQAADVAPVEPAAAPKSAPAKAARGEKQESAKIKAETLLAFLKRIGGLKDDAGELKAMGLTKGYPGLVNNKRGIRLDEARKFAAEAGYLGADTNAAMADTTVSDFLDAIAQHPRYPIHAEREVMRAQDAASYNEHLDRVESVAGDIDAHLAEHGEKPLDPEWRTEAAHEFVYGDAPNLDAAIERAAIRLYEKDAEQARIHREEPQLPEVDHEAAALDQRDRYQGDESAYYGDGSRTEGDAETASGPVRETGAPGREGDAEAEGGREGVDDGASEPAPVKPASSAAAPGLAAQRADVERALAEAEAAGGDVKIIETDENGQPREISARDALRGADDFAAAAREFADCILRFGE